MRFTATTLAGAYVIEQERYADERGFTLDRKMGLLREHFRSQAEKAWFTSDLFRAAARIRGMESAAAEGFAEGFYCWKACS